MNNLLQLQGAKLQCQLETKATNGAPGDTAAVLQYVKGGVLPLCEQGGTYTIGNLGEPPACSFPGPGHKLPATGRIAE